VGVVRKCAVVDGEGRGGTEKQGRVGSDSISRLIIDKQSEEGTIGQKGILYRALVSAHVVTSSSSREGSHPS
jgi:hypothetical protein